MKSLRSLAGVCYHAETGSRSRWEQHQAERALAAAWLSEDNTEQNSETERQEIQPAWRPEMAK